MTFWDLRFTLYNKPMLNPELPYWLAWIWNPKIGATRVALLRRHFSSLKDAWEAPADQLAKAGFNTELINDIIKHRADTKPEVLVAKLQQLNISAITLVDDDYPKLLSQIFDPPPVLFYKGDIKILNRTCLAVVGTRKASAYGLQITTELMLTLANANLVIVSGLAYGIDTAAHRATLQLGGLTAAVLACGLDNIYPTTNTPLAENIIKNGGLILTEYPPGTAPLKQNFPYRNRIIAGVSRATLVIEGAEDSGSLITAKSALEANREVLAVPGNIFSPQSKGTNQLLKQGAHVVTEAQDVLNVLGLEVLTQAHLPLASSEQIAVLNYLTHEPQTIDEIVRASGMNPPELMSQITMLEVGGYIRDLGGQKYVKVG